MGEASARCEIARFQVGVNLERNLALRSGTDDFQEERRVPQVVSDMEFCAEPRFPLPLDINHEVVDFNSQVFESCGR